MRLVSNLVASLALALCLAGTTSAEDEGGARPAGARSAVEDAEDAGRTVGHAARDAGRATAEALRRVTRDIGDALRDLADRLRS